MKIGTDYDGKNLHLKIEVPPSEVKELVSKIFGFFFGTAENDKKVETAKKSGSKKRGGP